MKNKSQKRTRPPGMLSAFLILTAAAFCIMPAVAHGQTLTLDFAANTGSSLQFNGAVGPNNPTFQINTGTNGFQFNVTSESGGSSAIGLDGSILNGPFSYGAVTTSPGGIQSAMVLGPLGELEISDGSVDLTGTINFIQISTYPIPIGALNAQLNVNVTDLTYSGTNHDLQTLVADQPGTMDVSFQFSSPQTLTQLSQTPIPVDTSYSASLSVPPPAVPEPSTWAMIAVSAGMLVVFRRRNKSRHNSHLNNRKMAL